MHQPYITSFMEGGGWYIIDFGEYHFDEFNSLYEDPNHYTTSN